MPLYLLRAATAYLWLHYPWTEHIMQQCMRAGASPSICIIFSFRNSMLVFRALIGRGVIPYGRNIHNSLCRTDPWTKNFNPRKNTSNHGSYAAIASMVGRKAKKREIVVPDPDYRIPIVLLGIAGGFVYQNNLLPAAPTGLLGLLLLFQTTRVRFVFDEEALEVKVGDQLQESGENVFVGGKNRWKYSTFVNWELWWPQFPVLVYFKETQTKPEGQVHFFPVIFNGKQLYDVMLERAGPTKTSAPK